MNRYAPSARQLLQRTRWDRCIEFVRQPLGVATEFALCTDLVAAGI